MTRFHRRVILALFILVFFLLAPVVVLYAYGWRWDATSRRPMQTGMIVYHNPTSVELDVSINGKPPSYIKREKAAWSIPGLLPGNYTLRWSAQGYTPLTRVARVRRAEVADVGDIRLVRVTEPFLLFPAPLYLFTPSPTRESVAWIHQGDKSSSLVLLRLEDGTLRTRALPQRSSKQQPFQPSHIQWSRGGNVLLLKEETSLKRSAVYDLNRDDWSPFLKLSSNTQWHTDEQTLVTVRDGALIAINVWSGAATVVNASRPFRNVLSTPRGLLGLLVATNRTAQWVALEDAQAVVVALPEPAPIETTAYPWPIVHTLQGWQCMIMHEKNQWSLKACQRPVNAWVATDAVRIAATPSGVTWYDNKGKRAGAAAPLPEESNELFVLSSPTTLLNRRDTHLSLLTIEPSPSTALPPSWRSQPLESWDRIDAAVADPGGTRLYVLGKRKGDAGLFLRLLQ